MDARIANTFLDYARQCDRTARRGKTYESQLKAKGRASAYRTAAKIVARKMLVTKREKRWGVRLARIKAAIKSARRASDYTALQKLADEIAQLQNEAAAEYAEQLAERSRLLHMATAEKAAIKPGVVISPPEGYWAEAYCDCGEVHCYYVNDAGNMIELDWPFVSEYVLTSEIEELGFRVES